MTLANRLHVATTVAAVAVLTVGLRSQIGDASVQANLQAYMATRTGAYASLNTFSFGVYSDIHMNENPAYGLTRLQWQRLLTQWRDTGNLFGMVVGDLGYGNATDIDNVLSGPATVAGAPPVFYAMGNHELDGIGKRPWIDALYPGAVSPASWTNLPPVPPGNADHAYFSFDVGPLTHLIILDGDYATYDGYNVRARQGFGQAQLTWLASDIRANAAKNILVFVHEPIDEQVIGSTPYYTLNDKGGLIDLLTAHPKQAFIFSGHLHSHPGITRWKGITSVHVMTGTDPFYGVRVTVNGDQIAVTGAGTGTVTDFDQYPMNRVSIENNQQVVHVAEDGANAGYTRGQQMSVVGPENGVTPTAGSLMLKATAMTWYAPRFISEQLIKIQQGMKFSFDMYLLNVVGGNDAVTVQPSWYVRNGSVPPRITDQNGLQLSRRPNDGLFFMLNEDVPQLGGRATGQWYHREFDLSAMAGEYVDGLYLTSEANHVNVGTVYADNIKFTWPAPTGDVPPTVVLTAPPSGATGVELATMTISAVASDIDGTVARVDFFANGVKIGSRSVQPYSIMWSGIAPGAYSITAVATDNLGVSTTSSPVAVTVAYSPGGASQTLLTTQVPSGLYNPGGNYDLGIRVFSDVPGRITALRFWKAPGETGVHVGRIWSGATRELLASTTFTNETASGWQQQMLSTPFALAVNTEYVATVNTTNGFYVGTTDVFVGAMVTGNLHAPAGSNGLYGALTTFPTGSYRSTNYFRDIVFVPNAVATATDTTPPTVSLIQPAAGATVSGMTTVSATASDNFGVAGVQFKVDSVNLGSEVPTPPYSLSWNTTSLPNGSHSVSAVARDTAGYLTTASAAVTVSNLPGSQSQTLLTTQVPAAENTGGGNFELGLRVFSDVAGQITALRFWKVSGETGTHVGRLWSATGQLLASVTFTGETASGWQQQSLATPYAVTANTVYVVSVNTTSNLFPATTNVFTTELVNGRLHAPAGNNGLYGTPGLFPTTPYANTNYFRDIVFVAGGGPSDTTLFTTQVPAAQNTGGGNFELGLRVFSDVAGQITALRFWKVPGEMGTHVGRLWSATGQLLASVTFTSETASGWQQQSLAAPYAVTANTVYVVSANTTSNLFPATTNALTTGLVNGYLHAPAGNNGLYGAPGLFPTTPYADTNYFRDIVFVSP